MIFIDGMFYDDFDPLVNLSAAMQNATPSYIPAYNRNQVQNMYKRGYAPKNTSSVSNLNPSNIQSTVINAGTGFEDVKDMLGALSNPKPQTPVKTGITAPYSNPNTATIQKLNSVPNPTKPFASGIYDTSATKISTGFKAPTNDQVAENLENLLLKASGEATEEATEQAAKKSFGTAAKEFGGKVGAKAKNLGGKFTTGASNTIKNFFNPQAGGWISYGWTPTKTGGGFLPGGPPAKTDWSKVGLNIGGQNIGKWANIGNIAMQGLDAISGLSERSKQNADIDDLESQILASAAGNPLLSSYLTSDDLALLGKLQRGNYEGNAGIGDAFSNISNILSGAGSGALTGALGGLPGVLIGGIGGAINAGIDNMNSTGSQNTARLEALYQTLLDAEQQYKSMKRPNFTGLGIQQRYQNMYA